MLYDWSEGVLDICQIIDAKGEIHKDVIQLDVTHGILQKYKDKGSLETITVNVPTPITMIWKDSQLDKVLDNLAGVFDNLPNDLFKANMNNWEELSHQVYEVLKLTGRVS